MKKIVKVVIVDDDNNIKKNLINHFSEGNGIKILSTFDNGEDALEYIIKHSNEVDLIIMDLLLPKLDGESLLNELKRRGIKIKTIITSSYKEGNIIENLCRYNVNCYLLKPYSLLTLERKIKKCFFEKVDFKITNSIDLKICKLLHNMGIPPHISGYEYIKDGIILMYKQKVKYITKEVYPVLANRHATTPSRIERCIRHAIEVSSFRGNLKLMEEIFGFSIDFENSKPTNFEFLSTIAERIKLDQDI